MWRVGQVSTLKTTTNPTLTRSLKKVDLLTKIIEEKERATGTSTEFIHSCRKAWATIHRLSERSRKSKSYMSSHRIAWVLVETLDERTKAKRN